MCSTWSVVLEYAIALPLVDATIPLGVTIDVAEVVPLGTVSVVSLRERDCAQCDRAPGECGPDIGRMVGFDRHNPRCGSQIARRDACGAD